MFPDTNHKGFDIVMSDEETGENWELIKNYKRSDYVEEWIENILMAKFLYQRNCK